MAKKVIVECKPDEKLVRVLGMTRTDVAHQPNKGEVCNHLDRSDINLAIIDEDPGSGQPKLLEKFKEVEVKYGIKKLQAKNKTILIIIPRLEEWILARCEASDVKPETFHLPSNNKRLKDEINYKLERWDELLQELLKKGDQGLLYLKEQMNKSISN